MPDIKIFPNFVSEEDIQTLKSWIEDNYQNEELFRPQLGAAHGYGYAYRSVVPLERKESLYPPHILNIMFGYAKVFLKEVKDHFKYDKELYLEGFSFTRLEEGIQLRLHVDKHGMTPTMFSGMLYLNDDFEDGEIVFVDEHTPIGDFDLYEDGSPGLVHSPAPGEMVIFRSRQWHASRKVRGNPRYAIVIWATPSKTFAFKHSL